MLNTLNTIFNANSIKNRLIELFKFNRLGLMGFTFALDKDLVSILIN